jgi:hypothetical protein
MKKSLLTLAVLTISLTQCGKDKDEEETTTETAELVR